MFEACDAAYARFLENHVQGLEEELRQRDHTGLVNNTRKVRLKYIRDEKGRMLPDPGLILGRWARFFGALNEKYDNLELDIIAGLLQGPVTYALGVERRDDEVAAARS